MDGLKGKAIPVAAYNELLHQSWERLRQKTIRKIKAIDRQFVANTKKPPVWWEEMITARLDLELRHNANKDGDI